MTTETWIMIGVLAVMFGALIFTKMPAWLIFMAALTACMTLGLAPVEGLLKGFSNTGVLTVAALFPVAAGMYATGAITLLSNKLIGLPKTLKQAQIKILAPVMAGSAFLNNTPLVAMMVPVVRDISRATGLAASRLYMPVSFASILGGAATLIGTSTNLIIAGLVSDAIANGTLQGMTAPGIFFPTLVNLPAALVGLAFIIFFGARLLPERKQAEDGAGNRRMYRAEFVVVKASPLEGKTLASAGLARPAGFALCSLLRAGDEMPITPDTTLQGGDRLVFSASIDALPSLWTTIGLAPAFGVPMKSARHTHQLVEAVISPNAEAVGRLARDMAHTDATDEVRLVGFSQHGQAPSVPLPDWRFEAGDAVVLEVSDAFFYENRKEVDFTLVKPLRGYSVQRIDRAAIALVITVAMVLLAAFDVMSMLNAALLATAAMLITGCLSPKSAWKSVEWETVVVLAAAVGLEAAVTGTGLSQVIANVLSTVGAISPYIALAVVLVGCIVLTNVITNSAAAALMFPVALSMATTMGLNFTPFVVVMMAGTSYAFINPAGYQTNLMVQKPGQYSFGDFMKLGLPLTLVAGGVVLILAPIFYPLR
jgi:di/tricarboxylate transporter